MSTDSVDLDSSVMTVEDNSNYEPLLKLSKKNIICELKKARQTVIDQQLKIDSLKQELSSLRPLGAMFKCEKKRGAFTYGQNVDKIAVGLLCEGESSRSINRFFGAISNEFPI